MTAMVEARPEKIEFVGPKKDKKVQIQKKLKYSERKFYSFKNLQFELVRRATFKTWNVKFMDADALAKNGFFYLQRNDMVQCYFCRGVIGYWEQQDHPEIEHRKHYPNCPLVQGAAVTNVPHDGSEASKVLEQYIVARLDGIDIPKRKVHYQTDSARVRSLPPSDNPHQFPEYSDRQKRISTFTDPPPNLPNKDKMADAGLFCVGLSDLTHCFECGGGVFNWSNDEDPEEVHRINYPKCPASQRMKRKSQIIDTDSESNKRTKVLTGHDRELLFNIPIVQKLEKSGYAASFVTDALLSHLDQYGTLPLDANEGLDILLDYEEFLEKNQPMVM